MQSLTLLDFAVRLGVGLGCGALIGVERQWRARMAGLRTNALVAAGATLFVL
jgi:putative Mg2+ transporter-C (MgtC) family protein